LLPGQAVPQIAAEVGVSHETVSRAVWQPCATRTVAHVRNSWNQYLHVRVLRVASGGFVTGFAPAFGPSEKIFGSVESPAAKPSIDARTLGAGRDTQLLKIAPGYWVALGIEELDALDSRQTGHNGFISALPFRLKHAIQKV
jgi:hypothetical protein